MKTEWSERETQVMREGGKDRTAIRKGREGKLNRRKEIWE